MDHITAPLRYYLKFSAVNASENQRHRRLKKNPRKPSGMFASIKPYVIQPDVPKICQHCRFRNICQVF